MEGRRAEAATAPPRSPPSPSPPPAAASSPPAACCWSPPTGAPRGRRRPTSGAGPAAAVTDVVMRGTRAVAVGDGGMILASADSGATWQAETSPTTEHADLRRAGRRRRRRRRSAGRGRHPGAARPPGPSPGPPRRRSPAWPRRPRRSGATARRTSSRPPGTTCSAATTALTFASLPGLPDLSAEDVAGRRLGRPARARAARRRRAAGRASSAPAPSWVSAETGLDGLVAASAPGEPERRLPARRRRRAGAHAQRRPQPRDGHALEDPRRHRRRARGSRPRCASPLPAPSRCSRASPAARGPPSASVAWTAADWQRTLRFDLKPALSHDYRLDFKYGGTRHAAHSRAPGDRRAQAHRRALALRPARAGPCSGSPDRSRRSSRASAWSCFTDRGGGWRPVSLQPLRRAAQRPHLAEPPVRHAHGRDVPPPRPPGAHRHARGGLERHRHRLDPLGRRLGPPNVSLRLLLSTLKVPCRHRHADGEMTVALTIKNAEVERLAAEVAPHRRVQDAGHPRGARGAAPAGSGPASTPRRATPRSSAWLETEVWPHVPPKSCGQAARLRTRRRHRRLRAGRRSGVDA